MSNTIKKRMEQLAIDVIYNISLEGSGVDMSDKLDLSLKGCDDAFSPAIGANVTGRITISRAKKIAYYLLGTTAS